MRNDVHFAPWSAPRLPSAPLSPGRRARPQSRSAADNFYCLKFFKLLCPRSLSWPLSGYPAADGAGLTVQVGYPCSPLDSSDRWHTARSERAEVRLLASTGVCPGHALGSGAKHVPFSPPVDHVSLLTRRIAACPMPIRHLWLLILCCASNVDLVPSTGREAVVGACIVAAVTRGSDAGSQHLDFPPVPSRKTLVGCCAVAAANRGSDAGSKS